MSEAIAMHYGGKKKVPISHKLLIETACDGKEAADHFYYIIFINYSWWYGERIMRHKLWGLNEIPTDGLFTTYQDRFMS